VVLQFPEIQIRWKLLRDLWLA